jgi:hypothetical protein
LRFRERSRYVLGVGARVGSLAVLVCLASLASVTSVACSKDKPEPSPGGAASQTPAGERAATERVALECLTVEAPAGSTKAGQVGGLAFQGLAKLHAGTVEYAPAFTVTTQAAEGGNSNSVRDEMLTAFRADFAQVLRSAGPRDGLRTAGLQPPHATPSNVAGQPGHSWQVDSIATFNGERLPWRAFSVTAVYRDRVYVVTAASALANVAELKPLADRYLASVRFDGCH